MNNKIILAIVGSASEQSSNLRLIEQVALLLGEGFTVTIFDQLKELPHFDPQLSVEHTPYIIESFRESIQWADGVLICTPEYVFSIPSGLKNALEWCVSTTVFSQKPVGLITASAHGAKGHEELQRILRTIDAKLDEAALLLIQGIKGKINKEGVITDEETKHKVIQFAAGFAMLVTSDAETTNQ